MAAFQKQQGDLAARTADQAKAFYTKFPTREASDARKVEFDLINLTVQMGNTNRAEQLEVMEQALLKDPTLSEDDRLELRRQKLMRTLEGRSDDIDPATLGELEKGVRALQQDFPTGRKSRPWRCRWRKACSRRVSRQEAGPWRGRS